MKLLIDMVAEVLPVGAQMLGQLLQCQRVVKIIPIFLHDLVDVAANQGLASIVLGCWSG